MRALLAAPAVWSRLAALGTAAAAVVTAAAFVIAVWFAVADRRQAGAVPLVQTDHRWADGTWAMRLSVLAQLRGHYKCYAANQDGAEPLRRMTCLLAVLPPTVATTLRVELGHELSVPGREIAAAYAKRVAAGAPVDGRVVLAELADNLASTFVAGRDGYPPR